MVAQLSALALLTAAATLAARLVSADVVPTAPGPGESFRVGQKCNIQWSLDTTGKWTSFDIQLMTGSNFAMVPVQTVATGLDGTSGAGTVDYTCPDVSPNAPIYFYQFSQTGAPTAWTTRFTIAAADGSTTKPTQSTAGIAWGTGSLIGSSGSASGAATNSSSAPSLGSSAALASARTASSMVRSASSSASMLTVATSSSSASSSASALVVTVTSSASQASSSASSHASAAAASASSSQTHGNGAGRIGAGAGVAAILGAAVALIFA